MYSKGPQQWQGSSCRRLVYTLAVRHKARDSEEHIWRAGQVICSPEAPDWQAFIQTKVGEKVIQSKPGHAPPVGGVWLLGAQPSMMMEEEPVGGGNHRPVSGKYVGILLFTYLIHVSKQPCEVGIINSISLGLKLKFAEFKLFS